MGTNHQNKLKPRESSTADPGTRPGGFAMSQRGELQALPGLSHPKREARQTLLHVPSRPVGTFGTSCSPALATNTPQQTQPCPPCLQPSMPH